MERQNFFLRLRKSEHASNKANTDNSPLDQPEDVNNKTLQSNDDKEENDTKESNVLQSNDNEEIRTKKTNTCKGKKKIDKDENKACKTVNKSVETVKNIKNDNINTPDLLKQLLNYTDLSIEKVDEKSKSTDTQLINLNTRQNKIDVNIELIKDEMNNRHPIVAISHEALEATNTNNTNTNVATIRNESNEMKYSNFVEPINSNNSSDTQNIKDQTTKCLKEFDKVLAEVEENHNAADADSLSLEGIDDITLDEELIIDDIDDIFDDEDIDTDSQEIKHITSNNEDFTFRGMTGICNIKTSKSTSEDNIDIISISSDDTSTVSNEKDSTTLQNIQNNITKGSVKEVSVIKEDGFPLQGNNDETKNCEKTKDNKSIPKHVSFIKTKSSKNAKICDQAENPAETSYFKETEFAKKINNSVVTRRQKPKSSEIKKPLVTNSSEETKSSAETTSPEANLDTISISSDENLETIPKETSKTESDDCGYHSSDFEFISEEEAKKDRFIINFNLKRDSLNSTEHRSKVDSNTKGTKRMQHDPYGPGPSSRNSGSYSYYSAEKQVIIDESYKENYEVPQEQQMVEMFHDVPGIPTSEIHFLENKSLHVRVPMLVQYEGIGFDMSLPSHEDSDVDDKDRDEAKKTMNKITKMYRAENNKRNRRESRRRR